jgi:dihydroorotate dehydrogenase electron transfer subunit
MPTNRDIPLLRRQPLDGPYTLLTFRHAEVAAAAQPGQFVMIKAGTSAEPPLRRPFSILSVDPDEDSFTLFVKVVGVGSRALDAMVVGAIAQCLGPLGRPFTAPPAGTEGVMVAGGYGIAPFLMLSAAIERTGGAGRVYYGGRAAQDVQLPASFDPLNVPVLYATEDGSVGHRGRVTEPLETYLDQAPGPVRLYACGPDAMLEAVARLAGDRDLEAQVSLDPWMGCGIGTCLGCVVRVQGAAQDRPRLRCACTEGPVFDATTVVWHGQADSLARRREEGRT